MARCSITTKAKNRMRTPIEKEASCKNLVLKELCKKLASLDVPVKISIAPSCLKKDRFSEESEQLVDLPFSHSLGGNKADSENGLLF